MSLDRRHVPVVWQHVTEPARSHFLNVTQEEIGLLPGISRQVANEALKTLGAWTYQGVPHRNYDLRSRRPRRSGRSVRLLPDIPKAATVWRELRVNPEGPHGDRSGSDVSVGQQYRGRLK